jgi:hypothetical protein
MMLRRMAVVVVWLMMLANTTRKMIVDVDVVLEAEEAAVWR